MWPLVHISVLKFKHPIKELMETELDPLEEGIYLWAELKSPSIDIWLFNIPILIACDLL